jgi:hypothetical protein
MSVFYHGRTYESHLVESTLGWNHGPKRVMTCTLCHKKFKSNDDQWFEYGSHYYAKFHVETGQVICDACGTYSPRSDYCHKCRTRFPSRNKLFRHLLETNHYV